MDRGRVLEVYNNIFIYIYIDGWNSSISIWSTIGVRISNIQWGSEPIQKLRFRRLMENQMEYAIVPESERSVDPASSPPWICFAAKNRRLEWEMEPPPIATTDDEKWGFSLFLYVSRGAQRSCLLVFARVEMLLSSEVPCGGAPSGATAVWSSTRHVQVSIVVRIA